MNGGTGLGLDDVDPAFGGAGYDVVAERSEDGYAGGVFCVLRCLFGEHGWVDFFGFGGWRAKRRGGEDAFYRFGRGDVDEDGLVFEEGCDEEKTILVEGRQISSLSCVLFVACVNRCCAAYMDVVVKGGEIFTGCMGGVRRYIQELRIGQCEPENRLSSPRGCTSSLERR